MMEQSELEELKHYVHQYGLSGKPVRWKGGGWEVQPLLREACANFAENSDLLGGDQFGWVSNRAKVSLRFYPFGLYIEGGSSIDGNSQIGVGVQIWRDVTIGQDVRISGFDADDPHPVILCDGVTVGRNVLIKSYVTVGSGSQIDVGAVIGKGVTLGQDVTVERGVVVDTTNLYHANHHPIMDGRVPDNTIVSMHNVRGEDRAVCRMKK